MVGTGRRLLVLCGPSGAGKGTLSKLLLQDRALGRQFAFSVSHTTRSLRPGERPGVDYYTVSASAFERGISQGDFVEHSRSPHGVLYGTSVAEVERLSRCGKIALLDLDWVGVTSIKELAASKSLDVRCVGVVVGRPELEQRLRSRATESETELLQRLARSEEEVAFCTRSPLVDATIVNTDSWKVGFPRLKELCLSWWPDLVDSERDETS